MTGSLYEPQKGTEFREPQKVDDWTKDEKLIEGPQTNIKIFFQDDDAESKKIREFLAEKSLVPIHEEIIHPQDYLEEYKKSIRGVTFGEDQLWIGPSWVKPQPDVKSILIEPGMAFGTGEHPTTQMAVECIWERRMEAPGRILDIGAGSGILSIACAKWISPAEMAATEIDPQADLEIRRNAILNGIGVHELEIYGGPMADLGALISMHRKFDWIISNIYGEVLATLTPQISQLLETGGSWIATGVLDGASRQVFESAITKDFSIKKMRERRDAAPNEAHLWLCYELTK